VWNSLVKSDETGQTHWHPPETMNTMALLDRLLQRVQIYCHRNEEPEFYQFASWPLHYEHTTFGFSIIPLGHIAPAAHVISRGSSLGAFEIGTEFWRGLLNNGAVRGIIFYSSLCKNQ